MFPNYNEWKKINEIGDLSSASYPWEFEKVVGGSNYTYTFNTPSGLLYYFFFDNNGNSQWEMVFKPKGENTKTITNKGELFGIMSTIFEIMQDFLNRNKKCKTLVMQGASKKGERTGSSTARTRIYYEFLSKNSNKLSKPFQVRMIKDTIILHF